MGILLSLWDLLGYFQVLTGAIQNVIITGEMTTVRGGRAKGGPSLVPLYHLPAARFGGRFGSWLKVFCFSARSRGSSIYLLTMMNMD